MVQVFKSNGSSEPFNPEKIVSAVSKAANRSKEDVTSFITPVVSKDIHVRELHETIFKALTQQGYSKTADCYKNYVNYKTNFINTMQMLHEEQQNLATHGDRENANAESTLISTQQSLLRGALTKELYKQNYLSQEELVAIKEGYLYIHDLKDMLFGGFNCNLFDMETVLKGGFEMANLKYNEPSSLLSALQVIGDVTLSASAQQFGGFTVPDIDKLLVPYYLKTVEKYKEEALRHEVKCPESYVKEKVLKELQQGVQSLEMKLNSIPSSRGDFAFTTLTFGNLDGAYKQEQAEICKAILRQRMSGNPVVFPKLVMLFSWEQNQNCSIQQELFGLCIKCSCKALYPDYLAIDTVGLVSDLYRETGKVVSPMGCRAYLSDYKDGNGESFFTGRANIGAVSLNLPMIWMKARKEGLDFYNTLEYYLDLIRSFLNKRYESLSKVKASTNPLCFMQGGLKGGFLSANETIGELLKGFTASFGITALNELNILMEGKHLHEVETPASDKVVDFIHSYVKKAKTADGKLFALYGTPAENLCGVQVKQFREIYGIVENVSDKDYFSNSFHCHVTAEISPFTKQDLELKNYHNVEGGHIGYARVDTDKPNVVKGIVLRAMTLGYYYGVNANLSFCDDCGWSANKVVDFCSGCGSINLMEIDRVSGYLGYGKQKGSTRFNDAKLAEVRDRVSM